MVAAWIDGYITSINQYSADTYDVMSFESTELLTALIADYCEKKPKTLIFSIINSIIKISINNRITKASPKVEIMVGARKILLYEVQIGNIKNQLKKLSLYRGGLDNKWNKKEFYFVEFQKLPENFKSYVQDYDSSSKDPSPKSSSSKDYNSFNIEKLKSLCRQRKIPLKSYKKSFVNFPVTNLEINRSIRDSIH